MDKQKSILLNSRVALALAFANGATCAEPVAAQKNQLNTQYLENPRVQRLIQHRQDMLQMERLQQELMKEPAPRVADADSLEQKKQKIEFLVYRLLRRAHGYLRFDDRTEVERVNAVNSTEPSYRWNVKGDDNIAEWTKQLITGKGIPQKVNDYNEKFADSPTATITNAAISQETTREALKQLVAGDENHHQMNLYYIAFLLLRKAGDQEGAEKCNAILQKLITDCEKSQGSNEKQIASAISVLNMQAYELMPVDIPDTKPPYSINFADLFGLPAENFSETNIMKAESLWLKSIALADKLPANSHTRRMAHRNLALLYKAMGKNDAAEQQKQILFTLIGKKGDYFLYVSEYFCGHPVWWVEPRAKEIESFCGMG